MVKTLMTLVVAAALEPSPEFANDPPRPDPGGKVWCYIYGDPLPTLLRSVEECCIHNDGTNWHTEDQKGSCF